MNNLWLDLINSDWHDHKGSGRSEDRLTNDQWLKRFLTPWQHNLGNVSLDKIRKHLKHLRALIRKMVDNFSSGRPIPRGDLEAFNQILKQSPKVSSVDRIKDVFTLNLIYISPGQLSILTEIAESFAEVLIKWEPDRIKTCINPDCKWMFYDRSKNRSRKWCGGTDSCGNLMKVRRFRAKNRSKL